MGYVAPTKMGSIIPPTLSPNVKFDITSAIIQLLNLQGVFSGESTDNATM